MRKIITIILLIAPLATSCRWISEFIHDDEIVAKAGDEYLYRYELERVVPKGLAKDDSLALASQYINSWAKDIIYLDIAESRLPKDKKDVTKDLEEYRRSLLKYRFEEMYVNARLDTLITPEQQHAYYVRHKDKFISTAPYAQLRMICVPEQVTNLYKIRRNIASMDPDLLSELGDIASAHDYEFTNFDDRWITEAELSEAFHYGETLPLFSSVYKGYIEKVNQGFRYIVYVTTLVKAGDYMPEELCAEQVKEYILGTRRRELIVNLEQELINSAKERGKFKIY